MPVLMMATYNDDGTVNVITLMGSGPSYNVHGSFGGPDPILSPVILQAQHRSIIKLRRPVRMVGRVDGGVTSSAPHRSGHAAFPHPAPHQADYHQ